MDGDDDGFTVFQDKRGHYRWRMHDGAGRIVGASSEGYVKRADCEKNMRRGPVSTDKWDFYKDRRGLFRWRRAALNGTMVGAASRGFATRSEAEANARLQGYVD